MKKNIYSPHSIASVLFISVINRSAALVVSDVSQENGNVGIKTCASPNIILLFMSPSHA